MKRCETRDFIPMHIRDTYIEEQWKNRASSRDSASSAGDCTTEFEVIFSAALYRKGECLGLSSYRGPSALAVQLAKLSRYYSTPKRNRKTAQS